jgi:hypothetical protein
MKQYFHKPIRDTVRRLAQIERCETAIDTAYPCKRLIRYLVGKTDEPLRDTIILEQFYERLGDCLLYILHTDRLGRDNSRRLERLRNGDNP